MGGQRKKQLRQYRVDIVLPTYNGEKYLGEQLESIFAQTHTNFRLFVRDDGSQDDTLRILQLYKSKYPERIQLIEDDEGNLKTANNVMRILTHCSAEYIMFSDQDDVWKPDKIEHLLRDIVEREKDKRIPTLVTSDSIVVNEHLDVLADSFYKYVGLNPARSSFSNVLQKNIVQGAACIINYALAEIAVKGYPLTEGYYHDGWLAAVAAMFGEIYIDAYPLTYYRQHQFGLVGAVGKPRIDSIFDLEKADLWYYYHNLKIEKSLCVKLKETYLESIDVRTVNILDYYIFEPENISRFFSLGLYKEYSLEDIFLRCVIGINRNIILELQLNGRQLAKLVTAWKKCIKENIDCVVMKIRHSIQQIKQRLYEGVYAQKLLEEKNQRIMKFEGYFNILNKWFSLKEQQKTIAVYFETRGYHRIAVYGIGVMGKHFYEEIENSNIKIQYFIDKNVTGSYKEIGIVKPTEKMDQVDVVVVTTTFDYNAIAASLDDKVKCPIISLDEVVENVFMNEKVF